MATGKGQVETWPLLGGPGDIAGTWEWDIPGGRLFADERFAALCGLDAKAAAMGLPTSSFYANIHPDDRMRIRLALAGMLQGAEVFAKEYRITLPDGSVRWVEARGLAHLDTQEEPVRFSGTLIDVSERKRAEERLRIAQTAGGVGTFEHISGFGTAIVSKQFCRLLGLHETREIPVQTVNRLVDGDCPLLIESPRNAEVGDSPYAEILISRADDQQPRWVARRGEYVRDGDSAGLRHVGVIFDITTMKLAEQRLRELNETLESRVEEVVRERQQAEEALRHSQKLEAVGQLTGGIAHDFNNLLTIIIGNIDSATRRLPADIDGRVSRSLDHAQRGAQRAAALTQRLLAFSRRQPLAPKATNIGRLLGGVSELLERTLGERVQIETLVTPDLWKVEIDPHQLENALVNLAVNARDAMPEGGKLTITAANTVVEPGSAIRPNEVSPGAYVEITVSDTGTGMPADVIAKAFDPFFTTKDVGKGTGLGLSMVYGFLRQSGGHVRICSEVDRGTSVKLYLRRLVSDEEQTPVALDQSAKMGNETVLLVEDDDGVRAFTAESLRELGYSVIEAIDGPAALLALKNEQSSIHLLLTDVVMPGMSGRELADMIRQERPQIPVLYISGYPRDAIAQDGRIDPDVDLLSKPFTHLMLSAKIREILDAGDRGRPGILAPTVSSD